METKVLQIGKHTRALCAGCEARVRNYAAVKV